MATMRPTIVPCVAIALLALIAAPPAWAAPSGLNLIPTADVLADQTVALEYLAEGVQLFDRDCNHWALLEAGVGGRLEFGVDRCFSGEGDTAGNLKYLLSEPAPGRPAVAVGVQALAAGDDPQPYLVATAEAGRLRLHAGAVLLGNQGQLMLGLEAPLVRRFGLQIDHITGADNSSGIGVRAELGKSVELTGARLLPNTHLEDDGWLVIVSLSYPPGG
jgi:hypothetical protein